MGYYRLKNPIHLFMGLAYGQTAHGITVKVKFRNLLCMADTDVLVNAPLVNPEQHLLPVDRPRQAV